MYEYIRYFYNIYEWLEANIRIFFCGRRTTIKQSQLKTIAKPL